MGKWEAIAIIVSQAITAMLFFGTMWLMHREGK
jgi:heme/copper-type cytochrome/quinol oxidase subunit 4